MNVTDIVDTLVSDPLSPHPKGWVASRWEWFPLTKQLWHAFVVTSNDILILIGQCFVLSLSLGKWLIKGRLHWRQWIQAMGFQATDALGMALVLCVCTAMVIALQVAPEMVRQGGESYVGSLMSLAMVRELAPIMTALGMVAVVSTSYASEWVSLTNDQQVDALRAMHVSPDRYWLLPWVLSTTMMTPLLTLIGCIAGVWAGMGVSQAVAGVSPSLYWQGLWQQTAGADIGWMLLKGLVFGFESALLACTIGLHTTANGAQSVGEATTKTVVACFVVVATTDYLLTWMIYGG
jgi:phospholipid/cholesterol/gamma-HCH transport system permease protein